MKGTTKKEKPDPLRMKTSEFDRMMQRALGVQPEPTKQKSTKRTTRKKS
jgi:hypothetical protein